jgi:uncharacterized protein (TIRG00374 family)
MEPEVAPTTEPVRSSSALRRWSYLAIGIAAGAVFFYVTARRVDLRAAVAAIYAMHTLWLLPMTVIFLLNIFLRSVRWRLMFPDDSRPSLRHAVDAFLLGRASNNVMPGKLGELVRATVIGRSLPQVGVSGALATVVLEKIIDALVVLLLLGLALLCAPLPSWVAKTGMMMVATFPFLLLALWAMERTDAQLSHTPGLPSPTKAIDRMILLLRKMLRKFSTGLYVLRHAQHFAVLIALTLIIWGGEVVMMYIGLQAFAIAAPVAAALVCLVFLCVGSMLPAAPGLIGTYQLFIVAALQLYAVPETSAFALSVFLNLYAIIITTALGVAAIFLDGGLFNLRQAIAAASRSA